MQSSEWIFNLVTILGDVLPDDQKPPMRQRMIAFYDPSRSTSRNTIVTTYQAELPTSWMYLTFLTSLVAGYNFFSEIAKLWQHIYAHPTSAFPRRRIPATARVDFHPNLITLNVLLPMSVPPKILTLSKPGPDMDRHRPRPKPLQGELCCPRQLPTHMPSAPCLAREVLTPTNPFLPSSSFCGIFHISDHHSPRAPPVIPVTPSSPRHHRVLSISSSVPRFTPTLLTPVHSLRIKSKFSYLDVCNLPREFAVITCIDSGADFNCLPEWVSQFLPAFLGIQQGHALFPKRSNLTRPRVPGQNLGHLIPHRPIHAETFYNATIQARYHSKELGLQVDPVAGPGGHKSISKSL
eukprot:gene7810-15976_t